MAYGTDDGKRIPNSIHEAGPGASARSPRTSRSRTSGPSRPRRRRRLPERCSTAWLSLRPAKADSGAARFLWQLRDRLGMVRARQDLGPARATGGDQASCRSPAPRETSLATGCRRTCATPPRCRLRLAALRAALPAPTPSSPPRSPTRPSTACIHLAWVDQGDGRYQGQMAVYVKPRGALGKAYMALIKPFRYWIVYPALMRQVERAWNTRPPE